MGFLADGEAHSSADMADSIGVSVAQLRTALGRLRKRDQITAIPQVGTSSYLWALASATPGPQRQQGLPDGRSIRQHVGDDDLAVCWERGMVSVDGIIGTRADLQAVIAVLNEAAQQAFTGGE